MEDKFQEILKKKKNRINSTTSKSSQKETGTEQVEREKMVERIYQHIIDNANIDPLFQDCTLENYNTDVLSSRNKEVVQKFKTFASDIMTAMEVPQSVYFFSKHPGIGKTHLAVAALKKAAREIAREEYENKEVVRHGVFPYNLNWTPVYFINVSEGLMDIKNDIEEQNKDFEKTELFHRARMARLVVLDDIFNELRYSPFVLETLLYWVDYRLKNNLATIFTSNHNFEVFLEEKTSPIEDERLQIVARNIASRVNKMVAGYKLAFSSSPQTDYRRRQSEQGNW